MSIDRAAGALNARIPRRSVGLKLLLVCVMAVLMSIPALFVFLLLNDRTHRAEQVTEDVSQVVGGAQTFLHKGTNGRWRDVVSKDDLARYDAKVKAQFSPSLARWIEHGRLVAGDPEAAAN